MPATDDPHRKPGVPHLSLTAARRVFERKGFIDTRVSDIAKEAKVSVKVLDAELAKQLYETIKR